MSELTEKLKLLNDKSVDLIVQSYEEILSEYERHIKTFEGDIAFNPTCRSHISSSLDRVLSVGVELACYKNLISELYSLHAERIERLIIETDNRITSKLRKEFENVKTDSELVEKLKEEYKVDLDKSHGTETDAKEEDS